MEYRITQNRGTRIFRIEYLEEYGGDEDGHSDWLPLDGDTYTSKREAQKIIDTLERQDAANHWDPVS
jgi:hypothetical protein